MRNPGWCCLCLVLAGAPLPAQKPKSDAAEVERIRRSVLLIDTHNDVPMRVLKGFDIGKRAGDGHTDAPRLREGGVGAVIFSAYVSPAHVKTKDAAHNGLEMIDAIRYGIVARHPDEFTLALTARDIEAAHRRGKIAALIGVEGGHAIEDSLGILRNFYALGVRYMTLTHANTNNWADSCGDIDDPAVTHHNGLTEFGRDVVREMNRLGMMVDISHVADKTFWDALETSGAPVFASHSSCRALCDVPRNMTDEMIRAMAKKGGVIQINFNAGFLTLRKDPPASLDDVVAHIDHAVKVGGIDAVGIGSDFDGIDQAPVGLDDVSRFPNLTRALLAKGYSARDIQKIYSGNLLRFMRAVESARDRAWYSQR
jgi:membrane dipeptidase